MTNPTAPTLTMPDNGYFETWTCQHGHTYRVTTEYAQDWTYRGHRTREPEGRLLREAAHARHAARCQP